MHKQWSPKFLWMPVRVGKVKQEPHLLEKGSFQEVNICKK